MTPFIFAMVCSCCTALLLGFGMYRGWALWLKHEERRHKLERKARKDRP